MQVIFSINFLLLKNTINAGRIFMQKRSSIQNWYNARRKNLHQIHFGFNCLGGLFVTRPAHQGIGIIFCLLDPRLIKRVYKCDWNIWSLQIGQNDFCWICFGIDKLINCFATKITYARVSKYTRYFQIIINFHLCSIIQKPSFIWFYIMLRFLRDTVILFVRIRAYNHPR